VKNEVLHTVKDDRNILHTIKRRKANWIGHILRRSSLIKHVIQGKIEGNAELTGRRGRRRKQLLDDLKEPKGFCRLKDEALSEDTSLWTRIWTCRKTDYVMNMVKKYGCFAGRCYLQLQDRRYIVHKQTMRLLE
jgi:hypothetical protein